MTMLDVFNSDAFGVISLTDAINKLKFVPGRIGELNLFQESGVPTTAVAIEERDGILSLVSPSPRGGPGSTLDKAKRSARNINIPHFQLDDAIMAEEVQNVRAWGSETETEMVQSKVAERLQVLGQSLAATHEYSRIGAIKGTVTYADASTLDLNALFGVTAQTEVDFDLDNGSPASGALRQKCASVIRTIATELGGTPFRGVHAFCGDTFFDQLVSHPEVRETYTGWMAAQELRGAYVAGDGSSYGAFPFGGIMWENYRGAIGGTSFVSATKAHIFPVGVPGLFRSYWGPADYIETVNTNGQMMYAKQWEMPNGKGINLEVQSNGLHICTRPRALVPARNT